MKQPLVSVIIPTYNSASSIQSTLSSLLAQYYHRFEAIVVDDGSTDDTVTKVCAIKDSRITVLRRKHQGIGAARNAGTDAARGDYIAFLDSDDIWTRDKLASQVHTLQTTPSADAVYSWIDVIDHQGKPFHAGMHPRYHGNVLDKMLRGCFIECGSSIMVRARVARKIRSSTTIITAGDWDYLIRVAQTHQFAVVKKVHVLYRFRHDSISNKDLSVVENDMLDIINDHMPWPHPARDESIFNTYSHLLMKAFENPSAPGRRRRAVRYFDETAQRGMINPYATLKALVILSLIIVLPARICGILSHELRRIVRPSRA